MTSTLTVFAGAPDEPWHIGMAAPAHAVTAPVAPPPGLSLEQGPAALGEMSKLLEVCVEQHLQQPQQLQQQFGSGDAWAKLVLQIAPLLDKDQLRNAIGILDRGMSNAQRVTALERMEALDSTAQMLKEQFLQEQVMLYSQLQLMNVQAVARASVAAAVDGDPFSVTAPAASRVPLPCLDTVNFAVPSKEPRPVADLRPDARIRQEPTLQHQTLRSPLPQKPKVRPAVQASVRKVESADGAKKQEAQPPVTLSSSLMMLSGEDADCIFIVRRINKLGFKASRTLRQHFSAYGPVARVLVAHSTVRQHGTGETLRRRPSSLGFVQMHSAEAVRRVLAAGAEQEVKGAAICVQTFEQKVVGACDDEAHDDVCGEVAWSRCTTADSPEVLASGREGWQLDGSDGSLASLSTLASPSSELSEESS
mmetsp:Transcript_72002/g.186995  ORF Transcript_72002/g.186995 Transcript_72002/m.186995 type:complete len:421 (-) Transcript_72002:269-1531(-)